MLDNLIAFLAPHPCSTCGDNNGPLCDNCKYDIVSEPYGFCVACAKKLMLSTGLCSDCQVPYQRAWCVASRRDGLQRLINTYKFSNAMAAHKPLAELLHEHLPELPTSTIIVPVPTVSSHIRQRGYDHMLLIAKNLAKRRSLPIDTNLTRATSTKQREADRMTRFAQAKEAFVCKNPLNPDNIYLLVDDVMTTGATMKYAAQALVDGGATQVWIASISHQPLD